jgi:acyl carrier protein
MKKEQIKEIVIDILLDRLGLDKEYINEQSNIEVDLGADSLDKIEVIMDIERKHGISIDENSPKCVKIKTVSDIINHLEHTLK